VIVAQALHWFDLDQFWVEVNRVLQGGVFAAWGYTLFLHFSKIDAVVKASVFDLIEPCFGFVYCGMGIGM